MIKGSGALKQRPHKLLWTLRFDEKVYLMYKIIDVKQCIIMFVNNYFLYWNDQKNKLFLLWVFFSYKRGRSKKQFLQFFFNWIYLRNNTMFLSSFSKYYPLKKYVLKHFSQMSTSPFLNISEHIFFEKKTQCLHIICSSSY